MIAPLRCRSRGSAVPWHAGFMAMLPTIANYATGAFGRLAPAIRQELVQEVVANCLVAYVRLFQQGRVELAYPTVLARYGIAQVKDGRRVGTSLNVKDVMSRYCQQRKHVSLESLDKFDEDEGTWMEAVVEDTRRSPVPDTVAFRVDFKSWLTGLPRRNRRVAETLALGNRTQDVAKRFRISEGRVSQLRRELAASWQAFLGDSRFPADNGTRKK